MKCFLSFIIFFLAKYSLGANILGIFLTPSNKFQSLWSELSLRGHNVTVITPLPVRNTSLVNLTEIDVEFSLENNIEDVFALFNGTESPEEIQKIIALKVNLPLFENQIQHQQIQELIRDRRTDFDVVITELNLSPYYCFASFFNIPWIGLLPNTPTLATDRALGMIRHPSIYPDPLIKEYKKRGFLERLELTLNYFELIYSYDYEILPQLDKIARKYFGDDIPYLGDIEKNVSLVLTSSNFITSKPKPTVPTLIEIGNVHLKKNVELPEDLKKEIDNASEGMIYFSLGSNVKSCNISDKLRNTIISAFSELPYKVLWKWETDYLPGKPDNVIVRKWLPQEAVLAHPNVKVFITQGGIQSLEEAIYYKKPLLGMPFFGDQLRNVKSIVEQGIGVEIDTNTITKEKLKTDILEVFHNKIYKEKISKLAELMWDQPMSGLDTAIWWIEYVIRHKGAKHLRSPLLDIPLYQYLLLDVLAFFLGTVALVLALLYVTFLFGQSFVRKVGFGGKLKSA